MITLDIDSLHLWAKAANLGDLAPAEMAAHPAIRALVEGAIDELNRGQASYATIKKFSIPPHELAVESRELTANFKVKRKLVEKRYRRVLDAMYAQPRERHRA